MTNFRFVPLAVALTAASALVACNTAPGIPMGDASATSMATPDPMARMDAQMKTMRDMHEKMMNVKTQEERNKLMAEHMKAMQAGMAMMADMKDMPGMTGDMGSRHQMMTKRAEMMQMMMKMMMDRLQEAPTN